MLKCIVPFNVLRHLQDTCSSWSQWEISDSQNGWGWKGPQSLVPGPPLEDTLSNLTFPEHVAQDYIQSGFEYLHQWLFHSFSGQPVPDLTTLTREKSVFRWNSMWFNLSPVPLALSVSGFLFLTPLCLPSQQVFIHMKVQKKHQQFYPPNSASGSESALGHERLTGDFKVSDNVTNPLGWKPGEDLLLSFWRRITWKSGGT